MEQAGTSFLAESRGTGISATTFVAIKIRRTEQDATIFMLKHLSTTSSENILSLHEIFDDRPTLYLVYEDAPFCLLHLTQFHKLDEAEIASIIAEIISGLNYVHDKLLMAYGQLNLKNVRICNDQDIYRIKLGKMRLNYLEPANLSANIGDVVLRNSTVPPAMDIEGLQQLLAELIKPKEHTGCSRALQEFDSLLSANGDHFFTEVKKVTSLLGLLIV